MVVIVEQLGMFGYALKHPIKKANHMVRNNRELTSLTLACELGRDTIFQVRIRRIFQAIFSVILEKNIKLALPYLGILHYFQIRLLSEVALFLFHFYLM